MSEVVVRYYPLQRGRLALPLKAAERLFASPRSLQYALVDEVGLAALHLRENVVHLLRGAKAIVVHTLFLAASAFARTAPALLVGHFNLSVNLHSLEKFGGLKKFDDICNEKSEVGRSSLPFGTLKNDSQYRNLYFPNPKENCELHRTSDFSFLPTLFKVFGFPCLSLIDNTKIMLLFELRKQNQDYFRLKSNFFHL